MRAVFLLKSKEDAREAMARLEEIITKDDFEPGLIEFDGEQTIIIPASQNDQAEPPQKEFVGYYWPGKNKKTYDMTPMRDARELPLPE